jgi:hypothetical protein
MWFRGSRCLIRQVKLLGGLLQLEVWAKFKKPVKIIRPGEWGDGLTPQVEGYYPSTSLHYATNGSGKSQEVGS